MQPADVTQLCQWVLALLRDYSAANLGAQPVAPSPALQRDHAAQQVAYVPSLLSISPVPAVFGPTTFPVTMLQLQSATCLDQVAKLSCDLPAFKYNAQASGYRPERQLLFRRIRLGRQPACAAPSL